MNIEEEGTPLADIMIEYGESIGKKEGKVEERKQIFNELREAAKADMTIKEFLKKHNED